MKAITCAVASLATTPRVTRQLDGASTSGRRARWNAAPRRASRGGRVGVGHPRVTPTHACLRCVRDAQGRRSRIAPGRRCDDVIRISPRATDGGESDGTEPNDDDDDDDIDGTRDPDGNEMEDPERTEDRGPAVAVALALIKFYRTQISPLTPPACRFMPTCSAYAMESFSHFGAGKGMVLTVWRLARCTPVGGKGYDPPRWPPVAFNAGSWDDYPGINDPVPTDDDTDS